jgi:putative membrane protein
MLRETLCLATVRRNRADPEAQISMTHAHHAAMGSFWISVALILAALIYIRGWLLVRKVDEAVKAWQASSFVIGLFLLWLAIASPLAALDHELLTAHMAQHLLLMTVAPPLILLGVPAKLRSAVIHPVICWLGAAVTLVVWHIPAVFMLALQSEYWHGIEQFSFLITGLLFWWPVVQPVPGNSKWPESSILLYLFLATLPCDILSGFLVFCDRVVYPVYFSAPRSFGFSALEDQQCAGALMWTCVTIVFVIAGAIFTARLLSPNFRQRRSDWPSELESMEVSRNAARSVKGV